MMAVPEPEDGSEQDMEALAKSRRWFRRKAHEAAARGDGLAGALSSLEQLAEPFFLGTDYDPDEDDMDDLLGEVP